MFLFAFLIFLCTLSHRVLIVIYRWIWICCGTNFSFGGFKDMCVCGWLKATSAPHRCQLKKAARCTQCKLSVWPTFDLPFLELSCSLYNLNVFRHCIMLRRRRPHLHCIHPHVGRGMKGKSKKKIPSFFLTPGEGIPGTSFQSGHDADSNAGAWVSFRGAAPLSWLPLHPPHRVGRPQDVRGVGSRSLPWRWAWEGGRGGGDRAPDQDSKVGR